MTLYYSLKKCYKDNPDKLKSCRRYKIMQFILEGFIPKWISDGIKVPVTLWLMVIFGFVNVRNKSEKIGGNK